MFLLMDEDGISNLDFRDRSYNLPVKKESEQDYRSNFENPTERKDEEIDFI